MTKLAEISKNWYPIYDQHSRKTIPFGAAHTYIADIREYPPGVVRALFDLHFQHRKDPRVQFMTSLRKQKLCRLVSTGHGKQNYLDKKILTCKIDFADFLQKTFACLAT